MGCQMNIPIMAVILTAMLLSTSSSLAGGLMIYFQGLESLERSLEQTSESEVRSLREGVLAVDQRFVEDLTLAKQFFFSQQQINTTDSEDWTRRMTSLFFAQVNASETMYYVAIMLHSYGPRDNITDMAYATVWVDVLKDGSRKFIQAVSGPFVKPTSMLDGNLLNQAYTVDQQTGNVKDFLYVWNLGFAGYAADRVTYTLDPRNGVTDVADGFSTEHDIPDAHSVRAKGPQLWHSPSRDFLYSYHKIDAIYVPPNSPHPWHKYRAVRVTVGYLTQAFLDVFTQHSKVEGTVILLVNREMGRVLASTVPGFTVVPPECQDKGLLGQQAEYQGCFMNFTSHFGSTLRDAFVKSGQHPSGHFAREDLGGDEHFIRRSVVSDDKELIWLRPVSAVEGEVREALNLLIVFVALVLVFDTMTSVAEVVFIANPLRKLAVAIGSIGNMDIDDANQSISMYRQRAVMVKEIRSLMEGMMATIGRLEEFRTFMPEAIFASEPVLAGSQREAPGRETGHAAVLFTDVQGSTQLWEECAEVMAEALRLHNTVIREVIAGYCGYEVKTIGDSFMVSFPDMDTAVRFGLRTQERLFQAAWPAELLEVVQAPGDEGRGLRGLRVRMGLTHGAVNVDLNEVVRRCDYFGPTVNRAARLEANGVCGGVAVEASVVDSLTAVQHQEVLVVQLGTRSLKGIGDIPLCLLVPQSMPQRAAHVHDVDVPNPLNVVRTVSPWSSRASTCTRDSNSTLGSGLVAVERFGDKMSEVGSATTGYVDCEVADLPCAEMSATADNSLRGVVACLGRSDGRLLNVCGTAALVAWNVMAPCAGHLEAALRFASLMSGRAAGGVHCGLSSGKVFSGYVETGKQRFVTAVGQCVQVSQRVYLTSLHTEQVALFAAKETHVTGAMVARGLATGAGVLRKGADVYTVCALLCDIIASRVERKQGLFGPASSAATEHTATSNRMGCI